MNDIEKQVAAISAECKSSTIREFGKKAFEHFNELRQLRAEPFTGPNANTAFRAHVMALMVYEFGITESSAATHYNYALKAVKANDPAAVEGLCRPDDKKGGRKTNLERARLASLSL